jgi:hypothetical protein
VLNGHDAIRGFYRDLFGGFLNRVQQQPRLRRGGVPRDQLH